jgi:hypothetical protein
MLGIVPASSMPMNTMTRTLYLLALSLLMGWAHASEGQAYQTVESAVIDAMADAEALAPGFEAGGSVYQCGAVYAYKAPVTQRRKVGVAVPVYTIDGCTLAAVYHTHPKGDGAFSADDVRAACALHVLSFIGPHDGAIRVMDCRTLSAGGMRAMLADGPVKGRAI